MLVRKQTGLLNKIFVIIDNINLESKLGINTKKTLIYCISVFVTNISLEAWKDGFALIVTLLPYAADQSQMTSH